MEVSLPWTATGLLILLGMSIISASPVSNSSDAERANLTEAIQLVINGSMVETSTAHTQSTNKPDVPSTTSAPILIEAESTSSTPVPVAPQQSPEMTILILRPNENIFSGLAESVSQVHLGGIIMEAFKLAQVSIALFAQSLAGQLGGTVLSISNTTRLIGTG